MRRFGVLYPEDDAGKQYVAAFRSEVERRGGTIVGVDGYSPPRPRAAGRHVETLAQHVEHLQALFLPDNVSAAQTALRNSCSATCRTSPCSGVSGWEALAGAGQ